MQKKGTSRLKTIGYWAATALVAFELLVGGTADLVHGPILLFAGDPAVQVMEQLGYPVYLLHIVGVWKLLGAVALLLPRFPRLKEWAYAGSFIALTGAAASWLSIGGGVDAVAAPLVFAVLTLASWTLRPPSRTLGVLFRREGDQAVNA